jgi:hypothetical protein
MVTMNTRWPAGARPGATDGSVMPDPHRRLRWRRPLYSQLHKYEVAVNKAAGATQFLFNDPIDVPVADARHRAGVRRLRRSLRPKGDKTADSSGL